MQALRVFISSTWIDMQPERQAVQQMVHGLLGFRFVGMEHFGARPVSTRTMSLDEVRASEVYVAVIGHRYGEGITEDEYREAQRLKLPSLVFLKSGAPPAPGADAAAREDARRLQALCEDLRGRHSVVLFESPQELATQVAMALHRLLFQQTVTGGLELLQSGLEAQIGAFVRLYEGTHKDPVAFGGRESELAQLDDWLADEDAPGLALVAGPAGRGKSALLVNWSQRVPGRMGVPVIFYPISVRYQTNRAHTAYACIGARLAQIHQVPLAASIDTPEHQWREVTRELLQRPLPRGQRVLLVIDGADEAADWSLEQGWLPVPPPPGLRIVVSARWVAGDADHRGWVERLGWQGLARAFDLAPLTPEGVRQVLRDLSVPLERLSRRADVVAELYRLSEGDPLLVNLYVADLLKRGGAAARLEPQELALIQPGLKGYFERWEKDQRALWGQRQPLLEPLVSAVQATLATALGPLRKTELLALLPPAQQGTFVGALDESLRALERFVVGDGEQQGHAFSHPRLAEFFFERLVRAGQARALELRFVDWGRRCLAELQQGERAPELVAPYLLRFLRQHVRRAQLPAAEWRALASRDWARAWEQIDRGSWVGFRADLEAVRQVAQGADRAELAAGRTPALLGLHVRATVFDTSLGSLASGMPGAVLRALVEREVWSTAQAVAYAAGIPEPAERLAATLTLAASLPAEQQPLAVAALVAELRGLVTEEGGRDVLREVAQSLDPRGPGAAAAVQAWQQARATLPEGVALRVPSPRAAEPAPSTALSGAMPAAALAQRLPALLALATAEPPGAGTAQARAFLLRALPWLSASALRSAVIALAPAADAAVLERLGLAISALPDERQRLRLAAQLKWHSQAEARAQWLLSSGAGPPALQALMRRLSAAPEPVAPTLQAAWWRDPDDGSSQAGRLLLHLRLARELEDPARRRAVVRRALIECLPLSGDERNTAAAAALRAALHPGGGADSLVWGLARWRGALALLDEMQRLLSLAPPDDAELAAALARVGDAPLGASQQMPAAVPSAGPAAVTAADGAALLDSLRNPAGAGSADASIRAWMARLERASAAGGAAAAAPVLKSVAAELWLGEPALARQLQQSLDAAALVDALRAAGLQAALDAAGHQRSAAMGGEDGVLLLVRQVATLAHRPPALLCAALRALQSLPGHLVAAGDAQLAGRALFERLLPVGLDDGSQVEVLALWLSGAPLHDQADARWAVQALDHARTVPAHVHARQLAAALGRLREDELRARLVEALAPDCAAAVARELQAPALAIGQPAARARALLALAAVCAAAERAALLGHALHAARASPHEPLLSLAAVRMVTEFAPHDTALLQAAVDTALALPGRALRARALSDLAPWLEARVLMQAASAFSRLDDTLARTHAMALLATQLQVASAGAEPAALLLLQEARAAPPVQRALTLMLAAARLPPALRWLALGEALSPACTVVAGVPPPELLQPLREALAQAMSDAPVALLEALLAWLRTLSASTQAEGLAGRPLRMFLSHTALRMLPLCPPALQGAALHLAERALVTEAPALWADELHERVLADLRAGSARLSPLLRAALQRAQAHRAAAPGDALAAAGEPSERIARLLQLPASQRERAAQVCRLALEARAAQRLAPLVTAAESLSDRPARTQATAYLSVWSEPSQHESAYALVSRIESPADRAVALLRLSDRGDAAWRQRLLPQVQAALLAEPDEASRLRAALELAIAAPEGLAWALQACAATRESLLAEQAVMALAHALTPTGQSGASLPEAAAASILEAVGRTAEPLSRMRLLRRIGPRLGPRAAQQALTLVAALPGQMQRLHALQPWLARLDEGSREAAHALVADLSLEHAWLPLRLALLQRWPGTLGTEIEGAERALAACSAEDAAAGLLALAPHWPPTQAGAYLRAARALASPRWTAQALFHALSHRADAPAAWADTARRWSDPQARALVLGLAAERGAAPLEAEALSAARLLPAERQARVAVAIARAAGRLPTGWMELLLQLSRRAPWPAAWAWRELAHCLDCAQAGQALAVVRAGASALPAGERRACEVALARAAAAGDGETAAHPVPGVPARAVPAERPAPQDPAPETDAQQRLAQLMADAASVPLTYERDGASSEDAVVSATRRSDATALLRWLQSLPTRADRHAALQRLLKGDTVAPRTWNELLGWLPHLLEADALVDLLPALAQRLPAGQRIALWRLLHALADPSLLGRASHEVARLAESADLAPLHLVVGELLQDIGLAFRDEAMARLGALAPLIARMGGDEACLDAMHAVADAGVLWP